MRTLPFFLAILAALWLARPPAPAPVDAPADAFSAERAFRHVEEIAAEPHPLGSEANDRVLEYLKGEIGELGLGPSIGWTSVTPPDKAWTLTNLWCRLPGTDSTGTVVLCTHYDSREEAPGAGDAASGVAAILETLRALREGPPLQNDLAVLFTDGEEAGLLGARVSAADLVEEPARAVVLNLEARGNAGPVYMFQTSRPNGFLVRAHLRATPRPAANSLMAAIYERMPNDTDLTVFMARGYPGLNFAMIEGYPAYHTPLDTPENLDRASLQHHGEHLLATVRELGSADLSDRGAEEVVYFDVLGRFAVVYPAWLVWPLTALAALLLGAAILRRRPRPLRTLAGSGAVLGVTAIATGIGFGLAAAARALLSPEAQPDGAFFAIALVTGGGAFAALGFLAGRIGRRELATGALAAWLVLLVVASAALPPASFLFLVPLLAGTAALAFPRFAPVLVLPTAILVAPLVAGFFHAMTLRAAWVTVPLVVLAVAAALPGLLPPPRGEAA